MCQNPKQINAVEFMPPLPPRGAAPRCATGEENESELRRPAFAEMATGFF